MESKRNSERATMGSVVITPVHLDTPWLMVPMNDPRQFPDESFNEYKKRVRKSVTRHLRTLKRTEAKPLSRIQESPSKLDHYEWLILYQCFRWPLKRIRVRYTHINSDQAAWMGLKEKCDLIGLYLRPKSSVKENLPENSRNSTFA